MQNSNRRFSKSQYCKARKCLKALWLYRNKRELADAPTDFQEHLFSQGKEVGAVATQLFPKGVMITSDHTQGDEAILLTKEAMANNPEAIFEAGFQHQDVLVRVDILKNNFDGTWDLIEVKSTNDVEPKAHYDDVAIQKWVVLNSGVKIRDCYLMHLNRDYLREEDLSLKDLLKLVPLDRLIEINISEVPEFLPAIRSMLSLASPPIEEIGSRCNNPYPCEFITHCWSHVGPDSIHTLSRISDTKRKELLDLSVDKIPEIPDSFKLSGNQQVEVVAHKRDEVQICLREIQNHLSTLRYPLYFLDYETVSYAIPKFYGTWPHKQLVTQYSLHIQDKPEAPLRHVAYIHDESSNPSEALAKSLIENIKDDGGSVVVYHLMFERDRTKELAEELPSLAPQLQKIIDRLWDLEIPFAKRWYWDRKFEGSSSIKNVLPVFKPDFSYEDLRVRKGDQAQSEYIRMIGLPKDHPDRVSIREALLAYCERDSLAMYFILNELIAILASDNSKTAV